MHVQRIKLLRRTLLLRQCFVELFYLLLLFAGLFGQHLELRHVALLVLVRLEVTHFRCNHSNSASTTTQQRSNHLITVFACDKYVKTMHNWHVVQTYRLSHKIGTSVQVSDEAALEYTHGPHKSL